MMNAGQKTIQSSVGGVGCSNCSGERRIRTATVSTVKPLKSDQLPAVFIDHVNMYLVATGHRSNSNPHES